MKGFNDKQKEELRQIIREEIKNSTNRKPTRWLRIGRLEIPYPSYISDKSRPEGASVIYK